MVNHTDVLYILQLQIKFNIMGHDKSTQNMNKKTDCKDERKDFGCSTTGK